jgi:hypothetical protein
MNYLMTLRVFGMTELTPFQKKCFQAVVEIAMEGKKEGLDRSEISKKQVQRLKELEKVERDPTKE